MIKYRYDLVNDPEPPNVKRIGTVSKRYIDPDGFVYIAGIYDTWVKVPCRRTEGPAAKLSWPMGPRNANRKSRKYYRKHGYPMIGRCRRSTLFAGAETYLTCKNHISDIESEWHCHWYNGDRYRQWHHLRGATVAVDLDALARMRYMTRMRKK